MNTNAKYAAIAPISALDMLLPAMVCNAVALRLSFLSHGDPRTLCFQNQNCRCNFGPREDLRI
jgi:hypothetical protein